MQNKRILRIFVVSTTFFAFMGLSVVAELFCGAAPLPESRGKTDVSMPELSGSYPVGRRFFDWIDQTRLDPFHKSEKRELVVSVWYPRNDGTQASQASYIPVNGSRLIARFRSMMLRLRVQSFVSAMLRNPLPMDVLTTIKTHVVDNAPISTAQASFPALLFSTGFGADPTEYTAVLEDIASHGYVVVAIDPTDFVPVTVLRDGRIVYAPFWAPSLYDLERDYQVWVEDILFVLNQIVRENKEQQVPLFNHINTTKLGVFGHSFGGAAAAGACHFDSRIRAGLNLDGAPQGDSSTWNFPQPFMLVESDGRAFKHTSWEVFFGGLTNGYRVVIKGSTHHAFTDEAILPLPDNGRTKLLVGAVSGPRMVQMTSVLVCAFFDVHLQMKPPSVLTALSLRFPELKIETSN
jgi:pimeloyl-ACP methyl ester carboxylesterase